MATTAPVTADAALLSEIRAHPPWIVGILNVTPDSFSDGGRFLDPTLAIEHGLELLAAGAHLIDIGGESTRPGSKPVGAKEEFGRIADVVKQLAPRALLSIDTYRAETADRTLRLGAKMINDVSALRADPDLASVVKRHNAYIVLMYSKEVGSTPHATESERSYENVVREISEFFQERIAFALQAGIPSDRIIIDPGMGKFVSHDPVYSWEILSRLSEFRNFGVRQPIMIGTSRKGFLGGSLDSRDPVSQLTALIAALRGAMLLRTHDVRMLRDFLAIWQRCSELYASKA